MSSELEIAIIDLTPFHAEASEQEKNARAEELVEACRNVGFVYIKGHGFSESTVQEAFRISKTFYNLPREEKMKAPHPPGWAVHRGYSWPGLEKVSNALNSDDAGEMADQLREVQDFKVRWRGYQERAITFILIWLLGEL